MMKFVQKLGKSLMLPVAVLPVCGLLMGIGYLLCPVAMQASPEITSLTGKIGYIFAKVGGCVIDNMPLLFLLGVSLGMSDDSNGTACIAGIVGWFVVTFLLSETFVKMTFPSVIENEINLLALQKVQNPFIAITVGTLAAHCYNKYKNVKLPEAIAFFSGRRFVPIIVVFESIVLSIILFIIWPVFFRIFVFLGNKILALEGLGVGIYVFLERLLIPSGLHHALNNVFWFDTIGIGDLTAYWAGKTSADVGWSLGMYMAGFFPTMIAGIPGAALAIVLTSKNKKKAIGLFLSAALCSVISGITEPFEFTFVFTCFPLYVIYSLIFGLISIITYYIGFRAGFTFSAGIVDLFLSSSLPAANNVWLIIPIGILAFILNFALFYIAIKVFKVKAFEMDDDINVDKTNIASKILSAIGGKGNIVSIDCCATRLRLELKNMMIVDEMKLKETGSLGFVKSSNNMCQIIIGTNVQDVCNDIKDILSGNNTMKDDQKIKGDKKIFVKHGDRVTFDGLRNDSEEIIVYKIKDKNGLHARPAGKLSDIVKNGKSVVKLFANGKEAKCDSVTSMMLLGIVEGTEVKVVINGTDALEMKHKINEFLERTL